MNIDLLGQPVYVHAKHGLVVTQAYDGMGTQAEMISQLWNKMFPGVELNGDTFLKHRVELNEELKGFVRLEPMKRAVPKILMEHPLHEVCLHHDWVPDTREELSHHCYVCGQTKAT